MKFSQPSADFYAPGGKDPLAGLSSTTHLGIGAHADDLEILAFPGIAACFQHPKNHKNIYKQFCRQIVKKLRSAGK